MLSLLNGTCVALRKGEVLDVAPSLDTHKHTHRAIFITLSWWVKSEGHKQSPLMDRWHMSQCLASSRLLKNSQGVVYNKWVYRGDLMKCWLLNEASGSFFIFCPLNQGLSHWAVKKQQGQESLGVWQNGSSGQNYLWTSLQKRLIHRTHFNRVCCNQRTTSCLDHRGLNQYLLFVFVFCF